MKTNDFLLGIVVGIPAAAILILFGYVRQWFDWPSSPLLTLAPVFVALFTGIGLSNVVRKSVLSSRLHLTATEVPLQNFFVECVGMIISMAVISLVALSFF